MSTDTGKQTTLRRPTAEEVCKMLEIMSMFADDDNGVMSFIYRMTHIREGNSRCQHEDWVSEFHGHMKRLDDLNKAPTQKESNQGSKHLGL